jgi:hypothetical protein
MLCQEQEIGKTVSATIEPCDKNSISKDMQSRMFPVSFNCLLADDQRALVGRSPLNAIFH